MTPSRIDSVWHSWWQRSLILFLWVGCIHHLKKIPESLMLRWATFPKMLHCRPWIIAFRISIRIIKILLCLLFPTLPSWVTHLLQEKWCFSSLASLVPTSPSREKKMAFLLSQFRSLLERGSQSSSLAHYTTAVSRAQNPAPAFGFPKV